MISNSIVKVIIQTLYGTIYMLRVYNSKSGRSKLLGGPVEKVDLFHTHNLDLPGFEIYTLSMYIVPYRVRRINFTILFEITFLFYGQIFVRKLLLKNSRSLYNFIQRVHNLF